MPKFSLLLLAFITSLFPQCDTGQLSGRVNDTNGAVVPAANVKLISQSTSQLREITTRDSGEFAFTLLPPGLYKLEVIATGFRNVQIGAVQINITQTTPVAVHLEPATVSGVVNINAGSLVLRVGYGIYYDRFSARFANTQLLNYPYFALALGLPGLLRTFADPFIPVPQPGAFPLNPTIPSPLSPSAPIVGVPISGLFVDPELSTPYVQQYNANMQWELFKDYLLEVGYVGSKSTKLLQIVSLNQPVYNRAANVLVAPFGTALSTQKMVANGIQQTQTSANSRYNSLQISMTKRYSRGLQFLAAYTLGKSNDSYSGGQINELFAMPGDELNWKLNYGPSDYDRRHRLVTSFVYDLPKFSIENRPAKALLNNWQLNGILTLQTGLPFTIIDSPNLAIIQRANFAAGANNLLTTGDIESRLNQYFNTLAFVLSRPILNGANLGTPNNPTFDPNNPFGNTPRNFLYGPGQKNLDFSVVKFIVLRETVRAELRAEFFNLFNWTNFANPNANIAVPATFGRITATSSGPRVIQFAFKISH